MTARLESPPTNGADSGALIPQKHGGALLPGGKRGHKGGGGRKRDAFKEQLERVRDEHGLPVLEGILGGEIAYKLNATCEHCGKVSTGPSTIGEVLRLAPTTDARLRAVEMALKYTLGLEKTVRLEGLDGVREAFEAVKTAVRATLPPETANEVLVAIHGELKKL